MQIVMGSDHAGYELKETLKTMLVDEGYTVIDVGTHTLDSVDYPDFGVAAAELVRDRVVDRGVLVCGSGIGIAIAANKVNGVRAANVTSVLAAQLSRQHNDANMVAIGARLTTEQEARDIVHAFLSTDFEGGRHERRVEKLNNLGDVK
jgi:ribose 5-phosphate isomerase B